MSSVQADLMSVTIAPSFARVLTKALLAAGFKITPSVINHGGIPSWRYIISKSEVISDTEKTLKAPPLNVQKGGVYHKTVSFMTMTILNTDEHREFLQVLNQQQVDLFQLGTDGSWLGFPYYLVFPHNNLMGTIQDMRLGLDQNNEHFNDLTKKYNIEYSPETRREALMDGFKLIQKLEKQFKG